MANNRPVDVQEYTQAHWIIWAVLKKPNMTTLEIFDYLRDNGQTITNITGRFSDARNLGAKFIKKIDDKKRARYRLSNPGFAATILERRKRSGEYDKKDGGK